MWTISISNSLYILLHLHSIVLYILYDSTFNNLLSWSKGPDISCYWNSFHAIQNCYWKTINIFSTSCLVILNEIEWRRKKNILLRLVGVLECKNCPSIAIRWAVVRSHDWRNGCHSIKTTSFENMINSRCQ